MSYNAQLTNFTIMGDSNDPSDARINGSPQGHFALSGVKATFKNLTLQNSNKESGGGAIDAMDTEIIVDNTFFRNNYSITGGAIRLFISSASIKNTLFENNAALYTGGANYMDNDMGQGPEDVKIEIINSFFVSYLVII